MAPDRFPDIGKKLAVAGVATAAFSNEIFGLLAHLHRSGSVHWIYKGYYKIFVDTLAVISAATLATMHKRKSEDSIYSKIYLSMLDTSIPLLLAYMVPSLTMRSLLIHAKELGNRNFISGEGMAYMVGLLVILCLSSVEKYMAAHVVNHAAIVGGALIIIFTVASAIYMKSVDLDPDPNHSNKYNSNPPVYFSLLMKLLAIFAIILGFNFAYEEFPEWKSSIFNVISGGILIAIACLVLVAKQECRVKTY